MAKALTAFKKASCNKVLEGEVIEDGVLPVEIVGSSPSLGAQAVRLLDQLERAGFGAIASKLRELQITAGLDALDPMVRRLNAIESRIDDLLALGHPMDSAELKALLSIVVDAYQARARALLLPYGTVSPRTALQGGRGAAGVNVAIGIGTGVTPRAKERG